MHSQSFRVLIVIVLLLLVPGAAVAANPSDVAVSRVAETTGDYYEPNDTKATATPIESSFWGLDYLNIDPAGDQDFFRFDAQAGDRVEVTVYSDLMDMALFGGNSCAKLLATNDGYVGGWYSRTSLVLPSTGVYCIRVRSTNHPNDGGVDFSYGLLLEIFDKFEPNQTEDTATPLTYGQSIDATFTFVNVDFYKFMGQRGDNVIVRVQGTGVGGWDGPILILEGPSGVLDEAFTWGDVFNQATLPEDGTYFVKVIDDNFEGFATDGPYNLKLDKGLFISPLTAGTVDGISFDRNDVLLNYTVADRWELLFNFLADDFTANLNAFTVYGNGLLLSFQSAQTVTLSSWPDFPTLTVMPHDIVEFRPGFKAFFDGSDVGLTTASEKIDALAVAPDGRLLISTVGGGEVPGAGRFKDEDILAFTPSQWGLDTAGTWSLYFDGSTVPGLAREDVTGIDTGLDGDLYLTLQDSFTISGTPCGPTCILTVHAGGAAEVFWDGRDHRFPFRLDGIDLPGGADVLWPQGQGRNNLTTD